MGRTPIYGNTSTASFLDYANFQQQCDNRSHVYKGTINFTGRRGHLFVRDTNINLAVVKGVAVFSVGQRKGQEQNF